MKKIIKEKINKELEGSYYTIGFAVPKDVNKITIKYKYPKKVDGFKNVVDLGVENEKGELIGWSGSNRDSIYIGLEESDNGYLSGEINEGLWKIIIGAYKIKDTVEVTYEIDFEFLEMTWHFGDLHMHSKASDGKYDIFQLANMAKKKHLNFLSATNHNNYSENINLPIIKGITLLPGVEWTHYMGHVNFIGLKKPFEKSFIAHNESERDEIINYAKKLGAIVSVNHPMCRYCPYKWDLSDYEYVEIWNGPMRTDEVKAINWWKEELKKGHKIIAIGGSDFHRKHRVVQLGNPVTAIKSKSRCAEDLISAVKKGNCYITKNYKAAKLEIICDNATFGDTIELNGDSKEIKFIATDLKHNEIMTVQNSLGEVKRIKAKHGKAELSIIANSKDYYFVEVLGRNLLIRGLSTIAISNPVHFI